MGGVHWIFEKAGYWDESFSIPLIIRDPRSEAGATRGDIVSAVTESVDVLPTILSWIGAEIPAQVDGWPLTSFLEKGTPPQHWRTEAHYEWDFRQPVHRLAESFFAVPSAHCLLNVVRSDRYKYVQFAADPDVLPPLLFDLVGDPRQLQDVSTDPEDTDMALEAVQTLARWRMRNDERTLVNQFLDPHAGLVVAVDSWR
jgi:arylsulfatase A-like enzyme